jgi:AmpE protein
MILGALSVSEELEPDCEITRKELSLMAKLYQRTLWFWIAAVSFVVILN